MKRQYCLSVTLLDMLAWCTLSYQELLKNYEDMDRKPSLYSSSTHSPQHHQQMVPRTRTHTYTIILCELPQLLARDVKI
jgi:hypothetical protein